MPCQMLVFYTCQLNALDCCNICTFVSPLNFPESHVQHVQLLAMLQGTEQLYGLLGGTCGIFKLRHGLRQLLVKYSLP